MATPVRPVGRSFFDECDDPRGSDVAAARTILGWYADEAPNQAGDYYTDVMCFGYFDLERVHTYIQWLFPLDTPSHVTPDTPLLTEEDIRGIHGDFEMSSCLLNALEMMLDFYGLRSDRVDGKHVVLRSERFEERSKVWLWPDNHNHLRLTRIIRSLWLLKFKDESKALLAALLGIATDFPDRVSHTTVRFWEGEL